MQYNRVIAVLVLAAVASAMRDERCPQDQATNWEQEELLVHDDCEKFYQCTHGELVVMSCYRGLYFNLDTWECDYKENVDCGHRIIPEEDRVEEPENPEFADPEYESEQPDIVDPEARPEVAHPDPENETPNMVLPDEELPEFIDLTPESETPDIVDPVQQPDVALPEPENEQPSIVTPDSEAPEFVLPEIESELPEFADIPETPETVHLEPQPEIPDALEPESEQPDVVDLDIVPETPEIVDPNQFPQIVETDNDNETPEIADALPEPGFLPNGCPVDPHTHWLLPHATDCNKFYYCVWGELVPRECPASLHFNRILQVCDYPQDAGCSATKVLSYRSMNKHAPARTMYHLQTKY